MKTPSHLLFLTLFATACLLPQTARCQSDDPTADECVTCANTGSTPPIEGCGSGGCDGDDDDSSGDSAANQSASSDSENDDNCPAVSPTNSFVHNGRMDYHSWAYDFQLPAGAPGCRSCGDAGSDAATGLASVRVKRYLRSRLEGNDVSSFGRASALAGYDVSIKWKENHLESIMNLLEAGSTNPDTQMNWQNDTLTWRPINTGRTAWGLTLFDVSGNPITAFANRDLAHTGVMLQANGKSTHFEIIRRTDDWVYCRPVAFADRNGNLVTVQYVNPQPAWGVKVATISEYFRRTKITDPYGRELLFEYRLEGNSYLVSKITHPDGQFTTYNYASLMFYGKVISSVNHPDGATSTETWPRNSTTGFWETQLFNATAPAGHRRSKVIISTNSGLHSNGSTVATVAGLTRLVENGAGEISYANRNDSNGKRIIYEGGRSAFEVEIGNATKGLAKQAPVTFETPPQSDFFSQDLTALPRANALTKTNGNNYRETSRTDAFGRSVLSPTRQPVSLSITRSEKPDGTEKNLVFNAFDTPVTVTDRLGRVTQREFDVKGNITKETRGFGTAAAATTEYIYNAQGLVEEKRDPLYDPAFPELHNTRYEYNANNFPEKIIHSADLAGGTRPETLFFWDSAGRLDYTKDPLGREVHYTYDNRSRLVTTTYSDSSTEIITYGTGTQANLVLSKTDRNGIVTQYGYDDADRINLTRTALGLPEEITETCQYLVGTRLKSVCIKRGEKTEYQYDFRNRLVSTTRHADANTALTTTSELDILGRTRSSIDPYGRRTFYLYDQNDRVCRTVSETVPNGLGTVPAFSNTSTQTAEQIEREIELTNGETITLRGIHAVTYNDARDQFLKNLTRDLSPNASYLITDRLTDAEGQILVTTDARGIESLRLYDVLGRVVRSFEAITLPEERLTETDYDKASNIVETRMPRHFAEKDANNNPIRAVERFTYNGRNLRASHTVAADHPTLEATQNWLYNLDGTQWIHTDFRGNADLSLWRTCCAKLQARIDRDGQSTSIHNSDFKGNPTHTATVSADPTAGGTVSANWHNPVDAATVQETTTRFDGLDRPTHQTRWLQPLGYVDDDARASLGTGNIPIATNPAQGLTTTMAYDENLTDGVGIDLTYAAQFAALATRGVTFNANANGFATATTNPEGETSVTVQDGLGRTVMVINGEGHIQTIRHDEMLPAGTLVPSHLADIHIPGDLLTSVATDALGHETIRFTDGAGRTLLVQDAAGKLSGTAHDANGNILGTRDANGLGQDCVYDNLNRDTECADLQEQSETVSRSKTYNAHNAVLTSTDAEGHVTTHTYDVRDRLASTEDANQLVTRYTYDANNNLETLTDGKNATRSWTYEERNLKLTKTMPDANDSCGYTHDALGRLKIETRQDDSTVEIIYDLAGRMTDREYRTSASAALESTDEFIYDNASRLTSAIKGRHAITTARTYADDGQMLSETQTLDGRTYTLGRTYYEDNRVKTQTFADDKVMEWFYDSRRLVTEVHYDGDLVLGQDHDDAHRLIEQTFANGLTRDIAFARQDNLRSADTVRNGTTSIAELAFTYAYFADKGVEKETQAAGIFENLSFTAAYDPGNRVTAYNRQDSYPGARETQSWNYDGAGNWDNTTIDGNLQDRDHSASDQLEGIGTATLSYDPRGNLLADERGNDYEWDLDNRIVKSEGSGYTDIEYRYDALGRRIVRKQGTNKEVLLWWGNTEQSEHKHQAGQTTIQNDLQANPSEQALNTIFARALEGDKQDIQYLHKNYLDHVMAVSDDNGNRLEHYRYSAFGEPEIYGITGTKLAATAIDNDILWNVRRYEAANGLYMYLYRDYDAPSGRWPSRDPIEEWGGVNLYGFICNDGVNKWDILGLGVGQLYDTQAEASVAGGQHAVAEGNSNLATRQAAWDAEKAAADSTASRLDGPRTGRPTQPFEFCGKICCKTGKYYYTQAVHSYGTGSCSPLGMNDCNNGDKDAGVYHSHPNAGETNATLSEDDRKMARSGVPPYGNPVVEGGRAGVPSGLPISATQQQPDGSFTTQRYDPSSPAPQTTNYPAR